MNHNDMPSAYRMNAEACGDDPRNWGFVRNTNLSRETFDQWNDRIGGRVVSIVMSLTAVFLVLGLAFGWFA
jgi:hypothetical protein